MHCVYNVGAGNSQGNVSSNILQLLAAQGIFIGPGTLFFLKKKYLQLLATQGIFISQGQVSSLFLHAFCFYTLFVKTKKGIFIGPGTLFVFIFKL
jgi:hypothetical protein